MLITATKVDSVTKEGTAPQRSVSPFLAKGSEEVEGREEFVVEDNNILCSWSSRGQRFAAPIGCAIRS